MRALSLLFVALLAAPVLAAETPAPPPLPRVFVVDAATLASSKKRLTDGDKALAPSLTALRAAADRALRQAPFTVVNKEELPISGDKHEFYSLGRYDWPNPATKDGLPYVVHDGQVNPEINKIGDDKQMSNMGHAVEALSLAYYFTGDEKYADRAALFLRTFFLDPATRMNPNLKYAQVKRGLFNNESNGSGLISGRDLVHIGDYAGLLAGSKAWTATDEAGMRDWLAQYLDWLMTSPQGRKEAESTNNHRVWFVQEEVGIALFLGKNDLAKKLCEEAKEKIIAAQIEPDGTMPLEMKRASSLNYVYFNLAALARLAMLSQEAGIDLWHYQTPDGRGIRKAFDFVLPYALDGKPWTASQIVTPSYQGVDIASRLAAVVYREPRFEALARKAAAGTPAPASGRYDDLLFPSLP